MKKLLPVSLSALLIVISTLSSTTNASTVAYWDFGNDAADYPGNVNVSDIMGVATLDIAGGELDTDGKDGTSYNSHPAGQAAAWNDVKVSGDVDAHWIMTINTLGVTDMAIRWDYKAWDQPADGADYTFDLDYRIGTSGDWINILNNEVISVGDWDVFSHSLAGIAAIENQAAVQFRMNDLDKEGNNKFAFDNLEVSSVPEPATLLLLAIGTLAIRAKK